ncbi:MAG: tripartite tricarboxylate transporter TctB family protein [Spirochaetales bacterium]|nr:tripartite tricarboxylate transporter TctB family protein [Spirochaetales bacterium]
MKLKVKTLPLVMTILSGLYLIYVISSEDTTLVADAVGGDPGGKLIPSIIAVFLFLGFLYITIKERPDGKKMEKESLVLFAVTFVLALLYVLLTKTIGFVILTTIVLYTLEYLYSTIGEKRKPLSAILGGVGTLAITAIVYTLMRLLTKTLGRMARAGSLPSAFTSSTLNAVISVVFVLVFIILLYFTLHKLLKKKDLKRVGDAGLITFSTVLLLYVVFKQFFLVALAPGLLNF